MTNPPMLRRDFAKHVASLPFLFSGTRISAAVTQPCVNVRDFGAAGDGEHDDAPAFRSAIAAVVSGGCVIVPPGRFALDSTIRIPSRVVVSGVGMRASQLFYRPSAGNVVEMGDGSRDVTGAGLEGVGINGGNTSGIGLSCYYLTNGTYVRDVEIMGAGGGVQITKAWYAYFQNVHVRSGIRGRGWDIRSPSGSEQVNSVAFLSCQAHSCGEEGFYIDTGRGCSFMSCQSEQTGREGFRVEGGGGLIMADCYAETNGQSMDVPVALQIGGHRRIFGCTVLGGYLRGPAGGYTIQVGRADSIHVVGTALEIESPERRPIHHLEVDAEASDVRFDASVISHAARGDSHGPISASHGSASIGLERRPGHAESFTPVFVDRRSGRLYVLDEGRDGGS